MNGYEFMLALAATILIVHAVHVWLAKIAEIIADQRRDIERLTEEIMRSNTQFRAEILYRNKKDDSK